MSKVPVGVSARHIHLSQEHVELLFGQGAELTIHEASVAAWTICR